jgi:hypothetical protein
MPTQEERLTTLEQTVALLRKRSGAEIQDLNRNVTMLLGIASGQELDIKEMKVSLVTIEDRLDEHTTILNEHTTLLNEHKELLHQILARLPEKP